MGGNPPAGERFFTLFLSIAEEPASRALISLLFICVSSDILSPFVLESTLKTEKHTSPPSGGAFYAERWWGNNIPSLITGTKLALFSSIGIIKKTSKNYLKK